MICSLILQITYGECIFINVDRVGLLHKNNTDEKCVEQQGRSNKHEIIITNEAESD